MHSDSITVFTCACACAGSAEEPEGCDGVAGRGAYLPPPSPLSMNMNRSAPPAACWLMTHAPYPRLDLQGSAGAQHMLPADDFPGASATTLPLDGAPGGYAGLAESSAEAAAEEEVVLLSPRAVPGRQAQSRGVLLPHSRVEGTSVRVGPAQPSSGPSLGRPGRRRPSLESSSSSSSSSSSGSESERAPEKRRRARPPQRCGQGWAHSCAASAPPHRAAVVDERPARERARARALSRLAPSRARAAWAQGAAGAADRAGVRARDGAGADRCDSDTDTDTDTDTGTATDTTRQGCGQRRSPCVALRAGEALCVRGAHTLLWGWGGVPVACCLRAAVSLTGGWPAAGR
jgi:hypothetical protein